MKRVTVSERKTIVERAHGLCEYCLSPMNVSPDPFCVEHVVPRSHGGGNELDNLALSCQGCNSSKYNKIAAEDSLTEASVSLYHPRAHNWNDHFAWSSDLTQIVGLTATGRATIETLQLNRPNVVNLRLLLLIAGKHPATIAR
ncbi:MAG: HNH endonuclease signature motif containing protein [Chloroflexia bacterium]